MNKYNVRAIRKELDDYVRNRAWNRLRSRLTNLTASTNPELLQAVVLTNKSSKLAIGGSLLHAIVRQRHEGVLSLAITLARAVPQALAVQDAQLQTPIHIAIYKSQPPEMIKAFFDILCESDDDAKEGARSSSNSQISALWNVLSTQDITGDTPLLKAARENETQCIAILLRYDKTLRSLLIQQKRKKRTVLSYMASNELHNAYKYEQYVLPVELRLVLIGTYFALLQEKQVEIQDNEWKYFWQELKSLAETERETKTELADDVGIPLTVRALVECSHLLGKYSVKLLDFLLANDIYRQCILSQEVDQHGNYLVHLICSKSNSNDTNDPNNTTATNTLLLDQLQQRRPEFLVATHHANQDGNMPLHLTLSAGQIEFVEPLMTACPIALQHGNRRGELPLHIALKLQPSAIVTQTEMFYQTVRRLWKAEPSSFEVRDGPTQLYPFQLAACSGWGPQLQQQSCSENDGTAVSDEPSDETNSKLDGAEWLDVIFTLLLAAPQIM